MRVSTTRTGIVFQGLFVLILWTGISSAQVFEVTKTIHATIATAEWQGWGLYSEPSPERDPNLPVKEQFTVTATPRGQPRGYSGKVTGLANCEGAEVGLVALDGVFWNNDDAYEWAPVAADGSFHIVEQRYPDTIKALCVRAPHCGWTFLRYDFKPGESGTDILLRAQPGKRVRISASVADSPVAARSLSVEPFEAYRSFDDLGRPLIKQRYGYFEARDNDLYVTLPLQPVALFLRADGAACYYKIIDPSTADHFHFVLLKEAKLQFAARRGDLPGGKLKYDLWNGAAPLSEIAGETDDRGHAQWDGLVPGTYTITIGGHDFKVQLAEGSSVSAALDIGTGKVITDEPMAVGPAISR